MLTEGKHLYHHMGDASVVASKAPLPQSDIPSNNEESHG